MTSTRNVDMEEGSPGTREPPEYKSTTLITGYRTCSVRDSNWVPPEYKFTAITID
jgi:hypothetical protein